MDPDEIEDILGGHGATSSNGHLARLVRAAQAPATIHELAAEDVAVAAFRRSVVVGSAQQRRAFSRFTPLKVAAAAAAFVVVGGGFTAALTHAFTHPAATTKPSATQATQSKAQVSPSRQQVAPSKKDNGQNSKKTPSGSEHSTKVAESGQTKNQDKQNGQGQGKQNGQGQGTLVAPGQVGSVIPASYHGLCLSYSKAISERQSSSAVTTKVSKLQSSKQFLRLAESALNRGLTVPEFCSTILGTKLPSPSVPGFGLNPTSSSGNGNASGSYSNTGDQPTGAGSGSSGSGQSSGGGGIVSAGVPARLP
ncbi:hypothetical protein [Ferrimicrobium sp.]|uniref:hypothetical protein n=1 Tax=Ferrimicrobium sp. TaxID=2926050 RepID=UPI00262BA676|nr:hypothetical protein [Ferrimicrobium sp.]